jgi:RNA polymerase sigma-70 factor (ECF subfamily)
MAASDDTGKIDDEQRWAGLMASAQKGCEADYRLLLDELGTAIERYLCSRFGRQHFTEDCVQESLLAIHQARHTYAAGRPFRPWMFAIVRHKAIDTLRRQRHQQQIARQSEQVTVEAGGSHSDAPEAVLVGGRLLEALPTQHREVITLTRIVGLSTAETAARLSISESAVKVRVHRAIGKLKGLLERDAP